MLKNHLRETQARLVIYCVTLLATEAAIGGVWLHAHGFQGGAGLTLIVLSNSISGLIGFLGGRTASPPATSTAQLQVPEIPLPPMPK
jgi:hypothetical protein